LKKRKKKKKRGRKKKASRVSSNKGEVNILRGKTLPLQNLLFDVVLFSPPPLYHFKKPFQNY
jgi:hypothetical protein